MKQQLNVRGLFPSGFVIIEINMFSYTDTYMFVGLYC